MSDIMIKVENLSKRYRIGAKEEGYKTFREVIINGFKTPIRNLGRLRKLTRFNDDDRQAKANAIHSSLQSSQSDDIIWALRNVSLKVHQGEVLGIIGRNGAGKTTLLKILSRITEPTSGDVKLYGRVSSLLEVGTGFHPELTGRENIYLNGSILGMRKTEIDRKFDEIVDFAEIEKFIYTPVKRYSSGMYVRLAFAVAAHLEPEILLVDEVLSVGDAKFQRKCLRRMDGVARGGRTVIFVSHQMGQIASLCPRCILINDGGIVHDGQTNSVINGYFDLLRDDRVTKLIDRKDRQGNGIVRVVDVWLENENGEHIQHVISGNQISIIIKYKVPSGERIDNVIFGVAIHNNMGNSITDLNTEEVGKEMCATPKLGKIECVIPKLSLNSGMFTCNLMIRSGMSGNEIFDYIQNAMTFTVGPGDYYQSGGIPGDSVLMNIDHDWKIIEG